MTGKDFCWCCRSTFVSSFDFATNMNRNPSMSQKDKRQSLKGSLGKLLHEPLRERHCATRSYSCYLWQAIFGVLSSVPLCPISFVAKQYHLELNDSIASLALTILQMIHTTQELLHQNSDPPPPIRCNHSIKWHHLTQVNHFQFSHLIFFLANQNAAGFAYDKRCHLQAGRSPWKTIRTCCELPNEAYQCLAATSWIFKSTITTSYRSPPMFSILHHFRWLWEE